MGLALQGLAKPLQARPFGPSLQVISLVPSHTETLYHLGANVVGRTRFCIAPEPWVNDIPIVGGTKDASLEKILGLQPDLVVVDKDENPLQLVQELQANDVSVLHSEIDTVPDAVNFILELGAAVEAPEQAQQMANQINEALEKINLPSKPIPVFCPIWHNPWMTFDKTAYPNAMLEAVGFANVFADHAGPKYFQLEPGEIGAAGAAWALLPTEPFPFHKKLESINLAEVGLEGKGQVIDGEALTWFGWRTAGGLQELARVAQHLQSQS